MGPLGCAGATTDSRAIDTFFTVVADIPRLDYVQELIMPTIPTRVADRLRTGLKGFQTIVQTAKTRDVNESDTAVIIRDMLSDVFGYDKYSEITSEYAVKGTFCDLATKIDGKIQALIEIKAVGTELKDSHTRQAIDYAVNEGTEWVVLTNAVRWRIYRVVFGKPIDQELVLEFDLLGLNNKKDEDLEKIFLLAKEGWNKSALEEFETYRQALSRFVVAATLTTDPILRLVRRQLRNLAPDAKLDVDQIRTVLVQEVLKRDVIEGEKAEEARKRVSRASKPRRSKVSDEAPAQTAPEAAAASVGSNS